MDYNTRCPASLLHNTLSQPRMFISVISRVSGCKKGSGGCRITCCFTATQTAAAGLVAIVSRLEFKEAMR